MTVRRSLVWLAFAVAIFNWLGAGYGSSDFAQSGLENFGVEMGAEPLDGEKLKPILREEVVARIEQLGKVSDVQGSLQRTFMSPAAMRASRMIDSWMQDAGMRTWLDDMANVHGRIDGPNSTAPALILGSHMDTVLDAGKYDGALGIITAIAAVKALVREGRVPYLRRPIEVVAFSDEEGVRFQSTFLGSTALTGKFPLELLHVADKNGIMLESALRMIGIEPTPENLLEMKRNPATIDSYIEVHIEQGPVLEAEGVPLGVVPAIAGQTRLSVTVVGEQGHAGTVPMSIRVDPMAAAAEAITVIENTCRHTKDLVAGIAEAKVLKNAPLPHGEADVSGLVCTVGDISVWPGASNVIPGKVVFSVDVRARRDEVRKAALSIMEAQMKELCDRRGVGCTITRKHDAVAVECADELVERLRKAASAVMRALSVGHSVTSDDDQLCDVKVPMVVSGAGHDAMAMAQITKVSMLFVRCRGGVSHNPKEYVSPDDMWAASSALLLLLREEAPMHSSKTTRS